MFGEYNRPFQLWSVLAMLRFYAPRFVRIFQGLTHIIDELTALLEGRQVSSSKTTPLGEELAWLQKTLQELDLPMSVKSIKKLFDSAEVTKTNPGLLLQLAIEVRERIADELETGLIFMIPHNRAKYYNQNISDILVTGFPLASRELVRAGNCFAVGEYTACVFHSMRGAEIGLRALATYLNITLKYPLELADWETLINKIECEIRAKQQLPKGSAKDQELEFLSECAVQFRYFKDAYRKNVAHARGFYDDSQSESVMNATSSFLCSLVTKLKEVP